MLHRVRQLLVRQALHFRCEDVGVQPSDRFACYHAVAPGRRRMGKHMESAPPEPFIRRGSRNAPVC
jgi:hypothetical protein